MNLSAQHALVDLHILPSDYDEQDYYRLQEVMGAREVEDRPMNMQAKSADEFLSNLGL
ncbi:hypothetical protein [Periweissella fabalis]|uniref:Uncharacterized protein n=1 Tax=Periweissella fabalis TaxID=1070421 RepID=A0A7X6N6L4_9LACO|nr:hypothetical protein [Periweissella fabalis]MCM0598323.1 hypothetical protein [Periweissella fabalis]NKZ24955.1 hypothetical protein [Periweissella fabalis]